MRFVDGDHRSMAEDPLDPERDCFKPPALPVEVHCLHCHQEYDSYLIEWRIEEGRDGTKHGFWCCPTPGCDGRGFGFDIFPTDPEYRDADGDKMWTDDDDEDDDDDDGEEWEPEEDEELFDEQGEPLHPSISIDFDHVPGFDPQQELTEILKDVDDSLPATPEEERDELEDWRNGEDQRPF